MTELERQLASLEACIAFPNADVRPGVWDAITATRTRRRRRASLVLAFAIVVIALAPALLLHSARNGILRALGVRDTSPTVVAGSPSVPVTLRDGERTTVAKATSSLSFVPIMPASLPKPQSVYVGGSLDGGTLTLLFAVGGRKLRLREFRGAVDGAMGRPVLVRGHPGVWLRDATEFRYRDPSGETQRVRVDTPGNMLLWQKGPLTLQLQAIGMTQSYALAFARTVL